MSGGMGILSQLLLFLLCATSLAQKTKNYGETFEEKSLTEQDVFKENLREVFQVPLPVTKNDNGHTYNKKQLHRHLDYMHRLYNKVSSGNSKLPRHSNTVRSIMPLEGTSIDDSNPSLLYDLSTKHDEEILIAALHLEGHKKLRRPRRLLLYLHAPETSFFEGGDKITKTSPHMTIVINKLPMEMDLTRVVKEARELKPPKMLRLQEQQLRRGKWEAVSSKRLHFKPPFLVVFTIDPQILKRNEYDVMMHSFNASRETDQGRMRRSAALLKPDIDEKISNEIPLHFDDSKTPSPNSVNFNGENWNLNNYEYDAFESHFYPSKDPKSENFKTEINIEPKEESKDSKDDKNFELKNGAPQSQKPNLEEFNSHSKDITIKDFHDIDILPTFSERKLKWKQNKRRKLRRRKDRKNGLIPFPDSYYYKNKRQGNKGRKKSKKGRKHKKSERKKSKSLPEHWFSLGSNQITNEASIFPPPSGEIYPQDLCERKEFYVDFKHLGWENFIVAPTGFNSHFCDGQCPAPLLPVQAGTSHALVQSLLRKISQTSVLPTPSCVPGKLDSITLLMFDESNRITLRSIPNMVVKSCNCQ